MRVFDMNQRVVKISIVKIGCIGCSPLLEYLLDERADRKDIDVRVFGSGSKLDEERAVDIAKRALEFEPDLVIISTPNAALPGPTKARELIASKGIPTIVIADAPTKKVADKLKEEGFGYIIVEADSMLGARREFLDPVEMAVYNSDLIKVLAVTGAFNIIYEAVDKAIEAIKKGEKPELPTIIVNRKAAAKAAKFNNPYAKAKAMAAFEMSKRVADLTTKACFVLKDWEEYTTLCAAAHELMRHAARLADEAREIEKYGDYLIRRPHYKDGTIMIKSKLIEKPVKMEEVKSEHESK
ncbi:MAG: F420-dependent methylenetetrahydromethanopterin dehydrogenase [Candidatus Methanomethylicota archaeon]|uniref:F420-dependent methylenetetrahydromethanopterin dehydrogenase n=1 Tax=Thermoproteota archaeon TaxID=2056631 RepID=A0A497F5G7_9CREN|nr:MAG: F420-dependent methylenetetrahydromethanopterin dehydrogenase [Candidatus Verstraetearchaeota archaeon]